MKALAWHGKHDVRVETVPDPTINFHEVEVIETLKQMTGGRGPDSAIDCVGLEAHGQSIDAIYDRVKAATWLATATAWSRSAAWRFNEYPGPINVPTTGRGTITEPAVAWAA
jgi:NADPH:quinone reductase-like Zn-dependent oxidoreductase